MSSQLNSLMHLTLGLNKYLMLPDHDEYVVHALVMLKHTSEHHLYQSFDQRADQAFYALTFSLSQNTHNVGRQIEQEFQRLVYHQQQYLRQIHLVVLNNRVKADYLRQLTLFVFALLSDHLFWLMVQFDQKS